jgi:ABC-type lipoprotein release transport system permease subunit
MFRAIASIFKLAFRNLQRRRWRTAITIFSLSVTVIGFISILAVSQYVSLEISSSIFDRTVFAGQSVGYPYYSDIVITADHPWWSFNRNPSSLVSQDILEDLRKISGVEWAEPYLGDVRILFNEGDQSKYWYVEHENGTVNSISSNIFIAGVDPLIELQRMKNSLLILEGSFFSSEENAVVGYNFAQDNNVTVGDTLVIPNDNLGAEHTIPGGFEILPTRTLWQLYWRRRDNPWREGFSISVQDEIRLKIVGIYWTSSPYDNFVITDYTLLQKRLGFDDKITTIYVKLDIDSSNEAVSKLWLIDGISIVMPIMKYRTVQSVGAGATFTGVTPTRFISVSNVQNAIIMEVAAAIFIAAIVYANVLERRWEIGLLKTMGFKPLYILGVLITESTILGLISGIIGFLIANLIPILSSIFNLTIMSGMNQKFTLEWGIVAMILSVTTITISSIVPALNAVRIKPIQAMGRG